MTMPAKVTGRVVQVIGPVVDIEFPAGQTPEIHHAIEIAIPGRPNLIVEVQQQLRHCWVRCVAMGPTEGLRRGLLAVSRGEPLTAPVGEAVLGRIINALGEPIDGLGPIAATQTLPIHRPRPLFANNLPRSRSLKQG